MFLCVFCSPSSDFSAVELRKEGSADLLLAA